MLLPKSNTPRWIIIFGDIVLSLTALFVAYLIRFDLEAKEELIQSEWSILSKSIWLYIGIKLVVFYLFKIHKGLIRHTSIEDFTRIVKATLVSSTLFGIAGLVKYYYIDGAYLFPTSVLIVELFFSTAFIVGSRFVIKLIHMESTRSKDVDEVVLIYGAGISGLLTKRTIEKDQATSYRIAGFIDDKSNLETVSKELRSIIHRNWKKLFLTKA